MSITNRVGLQMILLIALAATAYARADDQFTPVRETIATHLSHTNTPSIVVAVSRGSSVLWVEAFGWADREKRIAATPNTMYSLASDTKPLTATGLMTLVQAGKIALDTPVNDYLGSAKTVAHIGDANDATVRRVGNHSAGLPEHYSFFYANEPWRKPSSDESIRDYGGLFTPPGEHYEYSNLGYGILDYVIARVSREPFADYMRQAVFLPLGMTRTTIGSNDALSPDEAVRYDDDGLPIPLYETDHDGASAGWSSADDLLRFGMFNLKIHLANQVPILTDASIDVMHEPTVDEGNGNGDGYGLGWETRYRSGYRLVEHTGDMPGAAAVLRTVPEQGVVVVVLSNAEDFSFVDGVANQILGVVLPDWRLPPAQADRPPVAFMPPTTFVGRWTGNVAIPGAPLPVALDILASGDVRVRFGDRREVVVTHPRLTKDGYFRGSAAGDLMIPGGLRRPYTVGFRLKLRDNDRLTGEITARADQWGAISTDGWWPSSIHSDPPNRVQARAFVLAYWTDLHRYQLADVRS
jgi:CubicO group peptidase (beta-lactamase class C family)